MILKVFIEIKLKPWIRRLLTRLIAIIPALIVAIVYGKEGTGKLLVFSQVILSLQLSFAVIPLITITSNKTKMQQFVNSNFMTIIAWIIAIIIIGLNGFMLWNVAHRLHGFSQNYKSYKSKKGTENKLLIKMIINFL